MSTDELRELREAVDRLVCQSAALIHVLKNCSAGDGQPILNPERWAAYQQRLTAELKAKRLE